MKLIGILLFALSFSQCASISLTNNPPFTINNATYSHVTGGLPGNNTLNLMLEFTENQSVDFQKVYFQNRSIKAVIEQKGAKKYIAARYKTSTKNDSKDRVLHAKPEKEYGNTAKVKEEIPFELEDSEAILSYLDNGLVKYFKIKNIKKKKRVFMQ